VNLHSNSVALRVRPMLLLLALLPGLAQQCAAQQDNAEPEKIRAAMLFNIVKFVDWPVNRLSDAQRPFVACYIGDGVVAGMMNDAFRGKQVLGRSVQIVPVLNGQQAEQCHLLYVAASDKKVLKDVGASLSHSAVLSVGERQLRDPFIVLGLPLIDGHIRIQVDLRQAQASNLAVSSKLLRLKDVEVLR